MAMKFVDTLFPLLDEAGDGGGGGGTGEENPGGAGNEGAGKPGAADSQNAGAGKPGAAPDKPAEDPRIKGILADLQKERKSRQELERRVADGDSRYEAERRRVLALAGVNPKSKEDLDNDAVRERLRQLAPEAFSLSKEEIEDLKALRAEAAELRAATAHTWKQHAVGMLDAAVSEVGKLYGGTLTDRQKTRIQRAYAQEAENSPEFLERHERGDKTLITDFVKTFAEDFIEPARRNNLQTEIGRQRRVPSSRDRSVATTGGKALDFKDDKAVGDAMVEAYRRHGGEFGS